MKISMIGFVLGVASWMGSTAVADTSLWEGFPSQSFYPRHRSSPQRMISLELDPENILNSSFRIAAREDRLSDVKRFIMQGADIDTRSESGETALMYASRNCSPEMVRLLLRRKAEVNLRDFQGRTALIYAAMESCERVVELLLKKPTLQVDAKDRAKKTASDYAEDNSMLEVDGPSERIISLIRTAKERGHKVG